MAPATSPKQDILDRLRADKQALNAFGVESIALFGSYARDEARADSDIDLLVVYRRDARPDLFDFIDLKEHLQAVLGRRVDLVTRTALHPSLRSEILAEAAYA